MFFFFNDTATTQIYTLSLHDALPICPAFLSGRPSPTAQQISPVSAVSNSVGATTEFDTADTDRKSTRLNSSHVEISYAVFCLKKKKFKYNQYDTQQQPTATNI